MSPSTATPQAATTPRTAIIPSTTTPQAPTTPRTAIIPSTTTPQAATTLRTAMIPSTTTPQATTTPRTAMSPSSTTPQAARTPRTAMFPSTSNTTNIATLGAITGGSGYTPGTYTGVQMTLSSGSSATTYPIATIIASSTGAITSVVITTNGLGFKDTTTFLTAPTSSLGGTGSGFKVAVASLSTGQYNTADGYQAGRFISGGVGLNETSTYSTYIGYNAYPLASGDTNETVIGNGAVGSGSNTVTLGGTGTTGTIIPYGNVGIGTTAPNTALDVNGDITDRNVTSSPFLATNASGTIIFESSSTAATNLGLGTAAYLPSNNWLSSSTTYVASNIAGTGIGVSGATGNVTISNTGVTSNVAGTGISVSG